MHPQRKSQSQGSGVAGPETPITPDQRRRLLRSVDSDLESMLLEVDAEQSEIELMLDSVESGVGAKYLAGLEQDLEACVALKAWIRSKRAEVAELLAQVD